VRDEIGNEIYRATINITP
jgi:hypothetical protein